MTIAIIATAIIAYNHAVVEDGSTSGVIDVIAVGDSTGVFVMFAAGVAADDSPFMPLMA